MSAIRKERRIGAGHHRNRGSAVESAAGSGEPAPTRFSIRRAPFFRIRLMQMARCRPSIRGDCLPGYTPRQLRKSPPSGDVRHGCGRTLVGPRLDPLRLPRLPPHFRARSSIRGRQRSHGGSLRQYPGRAIRPAGDSTSCNSITTLRSWPTALKPPDPPGMPGSSSLSCWPSLHSRCGEAAKTPNIAPLSRRRTSPRSRQDRRATTTATRRSAGVGRLPVELVSA